MTGALWRSAFVAAVFAIHPLRVESVAWVAERKDVLSGLFFMLTLWAYVCYADHLKFQISNFKFFYALTLVFFVLGLMSKPMLVTLPLLLLLLDYWPLQRKTPVRRLVVEKWPLLALSAASCVATFLAETSAIRAGGSFSLPHRLGNAVAACMVYPAGLAVFYPVPHNGAPAWEAALAGTLLAGLSVAAWAERRSRPWLLFGWVWYLVMLLPVLGFIQVGRQSHADRYTYLPQIGIDVAVTWLVAEWRVSRAALAVLMAGVLAALMVCARKQTAYWKTTETLWTHALACTAGNDVAHYEMGNIFLGRKEWDEAINQYQQALRVNPDYMEAYNNLGNALFHEGRIEDAIPQYQKALQINPAVAAVHNNFGGVLLQQGSLDEAITQFREALHIEPDLMEARFNLGKALLQKGRAEEAVPHFQRANEIAGAKNPAMLGTLAAAFAGAGRFADAVSTAQKAMALARAAGQQDLAARLNEELKRYQAGLPLHQ